MRGLNDCHHQKSQHRPPFSQSPYRVGSGPLGPPTSPVFLFTPYSSTSPSFTVPSRFSLRVPEAESDDTSSFLFSFAFSS
ncbi:hypothetical protein AQUCO_08300051v1 [Aquilegia coerulea]|uniref:Uncharacterized protein n=1 Tax=Aquilegia coerulea TaxID=218851 RepID=A0A2G5C741_AQUCA|nr:hypothetical protein AQUCO_08300051v1 [Aquilegia coerulea]